MEVVERAELYLRLRAEELLDPARSVWEMANGGGVERLVAVAEALAAIGAIDNGAFGAVIADIELAGWLRQRSLGPASRVEATLSSAFAPAPQGWPPVVTACGAQLALAGSTVALCWLTRSGTEVRARLQVVTPPAVAGSGPGRPMYGSSPLARVAPFASAAMRPGQLEPPAAEPIDLTQLRVVDDAGVGYVLTWEQFKMEWAPLDPDIPEPTIAGGVVRITPPVPSTALWLELRVPVAGTGGGTGGADAGTGGPDVRADESVRAELASPPAAEMGHEESPVSPADHFLARAEAVHLARQASGEGLGLPAHRAAREATRAAIREAFAELGFLDSAGASRTGPVDGLGSGVPVPVLDGDAGQSSRRHGSWPIGVELPLERSRVFVEGVTAAGGTVTLHVQLAGDGRGTPAHFAGPPWFSAIDDLGVRHEQAVATQVGDERGRRVAVTLSGVLAPAARKLRVVGETPFESAFVELEI